MVARPPSATVLAARLRAQHGAPEPPLTRDAFELVLLENVAYLASPERRRLAFETLRKTVGTTPAAILAANRRTLERVTGHGILAETFAAKLVACACIVRDDFGGDMSTIATLPTGEAIKRLRRFPGIGLPGAEKILLMMGRLARLAPESNGLRVLQRLGLVDARLAYGRAYAASASVPGVAALDAPALGELHLLLQRHGQTVCRRTTPDCPSCTLRSCCPSATSAAPVRVGVKGRE